jgi:hypothetical protein
MVLVLTQYLRLLAQPIVVAVVVAATMTLAMALAVLAVQVSSFSVISHLTHPQQVSRLAVEQ